jgi:hypothetical protein
LEYSALHPQQWGKSRFAISGLEVELDPDVPDVSNGLVRSRFEVMVQSTKRELGAIRDAEPRHAALAGVLTIVAQETMVVLSEPGARQARDLSAPCRSARRPGRTQSPAPMIGINA